MIKVKPLRSKLAVVGAVLALTVGTLGATEAANLPEIKVDVVEAMKELARWVTAGFNRWDDGQKQSVKEAIANVASDLVAIAAVKRRLPDSFVRMGFSGRADDILKAQAKDLATFVAKLRDDMSQIDPEWRLKNITTLSALDEAVQLRGANSIIVGAVVQTSSGKVPTRNDVLENMNLRAFADRQEDEANQLVDLAKKLSQTASGSNVN